MGKLSSLLLILVVLLLAFQVWQTMEMRKELHLLSQQIAAQTVFVTEEVDEASLSAAVGKFEQAARAAKRGDLQTAQQAAREGYALVEPAARPLLEWGPALQELESVKEFLQRQFRGIYQPYEEEAQ